MQSLLRVTGRPGALCIVLLLLAAACGGAQEPAAAPEAEVATAPQVAESMMPLDPSILADETRPADEVAQDSGRKPLEVYEFFGVQPGMTVADVWPGAGYNTHLLSRIAGADGSVYAVMGFYAEGDYATLEGVSQRVADAGLNNVMIVDGITDVPADTLDVAIAVRNYHDAANFSAGRTATVGELFAAVRPGGVVGIVEVATDRDGWDEETHRLNEQVVIDEFTAGGFALEARSDMLANPDDDYSVSGFEEGRHTMDRYVLKFRKPMS